MTTTETIAFDRDRLAAWYAKRHLEIDPGVEQIHYLPVESPDREVRLLEVNRLIPELTGVELEPIDFGVDIDDANGHTLYVLDVTPRQWAEIEVGRLALPAGWHSEGRRTFQRGT